MAAMAVNNEEAAGWENVGCLLGEYTPEPFVA
jgi:hypothetical protein